MQMDWTMATTTKATTQAKMMKNFSHVPKIVSTFEQIWSNISELLPEASSSATGWLSTEKSMTRGYFRKHHVGNIKNPRGQRRNGIIHKRG